MTSALSLLPVTALAYFPLFLEEFEQPKAAALVAFSCFAVFFIDWRKLRWNIVAWALGLCVISAAVSTVTSIDWRTSLYGNPKCPGGLLVIASYLVAYAAFAVALKKKDARELAVTILLWCAGIVAGYACLQSVGIDYKEWFGAVQLNKYTRPMSTLGHPNFMAAYLAMALPFVLYRLERSRWYAPLVPLYLAAIFLSQSRGMWLATLAGMGVYALQRRVPLKRIAQATAVAALVVVAVCAAVPSIRSEAVDRAATILSPGPSRVEYWTAAARIATRYPALGSGTDTYEMAFQHQRTPLYWAIERNGSPHRAHNDLLNALATQGVFGVIAFMALFAVAAGVCVFSRSVYAPAASAAIAAHYVEGLSSFTVVATGTLFMFCLALLTYDFDV